MFWMSLQQLQWKIIWPCRQPHFMTSHAPEKELTDDIVQVFLEKEFKTSPMYEGSGRGALMVSKNLGILKVGSDKYMKAGSELLKRLDKNEQSYVAAPWWFGFNASMHAAGPEFGLVASL